MGIEAIPPISPRSRWEPPLAPAEVDQSAEDRDSGGGAYERRARRRRQAADGPAERDSAPPPEPGDEPPEGYRVDVRA